MAEKKYLLDYIAAIDYIGGILPPKAIAWLDETIDKEVAMSIINRIEILILILPTQTTSFLLKN